MTDKQIIEILATKVMGWKADGIAYVKADNPEYMVGVQVAEWNPLEDLNHAFEVVEKLRGSISILVESFPDGYEGIARKEYGDCRVLAEISAKTPQEAICNAAMKVVAENYGN
ncbi:hypothetical protein B9C88_21550 [Brevibacillus laterosporus]|uniref:BC1872 family protein n=1 Tax=Brevibacillus laterosporus TaxID=1465 RepID=UPI000BD07A15|nr:hypothetical protein [Brevibacillus laterosporus]PCN42288.1 hypothetical protein B9C88_21550 [Brevibacillus laterosporus]